MPGHRLHNLFGLAGVAADERPRARRWASRLEVPMILLAIWILVEWYVTARGIYPAKLSRFTDWAIWVFFLFETVALSILVRDTRRYLRTNWMNLLIIVMGIPFLWGGDSYAAALRTLRLFLILPLLASVSDTARNLLMHNRLGTTLLVALVFTLMSGLLIAAIDPSFHSVWDGLWWAWVTVATVGYGDIVPQSAAGKVFGAILILFGVGFFSLLTASFSSYFVSREEEEIKEDEAEELDRLECLDERMKRIENALERIEKKLSDTNPL